MFPCFRKCSTTKNENPEMLEINRKLYNNKNHALLMVIYTITRPLYIPFFIFAANYIKKNRQNIIHILI